MYALWAINQESQRVANTIYFISIHDWSWKKIKSTNSQFWFLIESESEKNFKYIISYEKFQFGLEQISNIFD